MKKLLVVSLSASGFAIFSLVTEASDPWHVEGDPKAIAQEIQFTNRVSILLEHYIFRNTATICLRLWRSMAHRTQRVTRRSTDICAKVYQR
jgi:hypothetical protein